MPELKHRWLPVTLLRTVDLNVTLFNLPPSSSTDRTFPLFLIKNLSYYCDLPSRLSVDMSKSRPIPTSFLANREDEGCIPLQSPATMVPWPHRPLPCAGSLPHSLALLCLFPSLSMVMVTFLSIFRYVQIFPIHRSLLHLDYLSLGKIFFPSLCSLLGDTTLHAVSQAWLSFLMPSSVSQSPQLQILEHKFLHLLSSLYFYERFLRSYLSTLTRIIVAFASSYLLSMLQSKLAI